MRIICEKCQSKFNLDESLLKEEGSKVKCSVCKHVFTAFPPEPESLEEPEFDELPDDELEETVTLDSPPVMDDLSFEEKDEKAKDAFDRAFENALEEEIQETAGEEAREDLGPDEETREAGEGQVEELPERPEKEPAPSEPAPSKKKAAKSKGLLIILVILLLIIIGGIVVFYFAPDIIPISSLRPVKKEEVTDTGIRRLSFKGVSGSFIKSDRLGDLFVIKGEVINNNPKSRSFILLKGTIFDTTGKAIRRKLVFAGNTFDDDELKEMSLEEIDRGLKRQTGKGNINVDVKPSSAVPFMIIFENLPENLSEFEVEAVSSAPGKGA